MDNLAICACCHSPIQVPLDGNGEATPEVVAYHSAQECPTCYYKVHAYCLHDGVCLHCYNKPQVKTDGDFCGNACPMLADMLHRCRHYADAPRLQSVVGCHAGRFLRCDECLKEFP